MRSRMLSSCLILSCLWMGMDAAVLSSDRLVPNDIVLPVDVPKMSGPRDSTEIPTKQDVNSSFLGSLEGGFVTGVLSAFTMTAVSEIGDKTFFIALVLALSHPPTQVFGGALFALALMTVLSACLGLVFSFLSSVWVHYLSALLFLVFGFKMLREGCFMSSSAGQEEFEGVQKIVEKRLVDKGKGTVDIEAGPASANVAVRVILESFTMTFLSEWGDRSQIATVILAAKHNVFSVVLGSVLGHAVCTLMAVVGGRLIADRISVRTVTVFGGILFLAFAFSSLIGALDETIETSSS